MSDEQIANVFGDEYTKSTRGTNYEAGTDLGLGLCQEFVKGHQGKIWATKNDQSDHGVTIYFTINKNISIQNEKTDIYL